MKVQVTKITVGLIQTNCYLISKDNNCFLIDPGDEADKILEKLKIENLSLQFVLLTHGHFDHVLALPKIAQIYPNAKVYLSKHDWDLAKNASSEAANFGFSSPAVLKNILFSEPKTKIEFNGQAIQVIPTPGHTIGSVCYLMGDTLFSGDTLFYGSIGRTDLAGGDLTQLKNSLVELAKLPDSTKVLPGHGQSTSISQEKLYGYLKAL